MIGTSVAASSAMVPFTVSSASGPPAITVCTTTRCPSSWSRAKTPFSTTWPSSGASATMATGSSKA